MDRSYLTKYLSAQKSYRESEDISYDRITKDCTKVWSPYEDGFQEFLEFITDN